MLKAWKSPLRVALLGLLLAGLGLGCAKKEPPKPQVRTAPAVEVPAPPTVEAPNLFAYLKLSEPARTIDRLAGWTSMVQPMLNGAMLRSQFEAAGLNLADFRKGEHLSLFLFDPAGNMFDMPLAGLFPVDFKSATAQRLSAMMSSDSLTSIGQYTLVAKNKAGLASAVQLGDTLASLNKAPMANDLQLYLNCQAIMEKYGAALNSQIQALQALMGAAGQGQPAQAQAQRVLSAEMKAMQDVLGQTKFLTVGLNLAPEALELSMILKAKPGTAMEGALKKQPLAAPDLTQYLNPKAAMRGQQSIYDFKKFMDVYLKYIALALPTEQQAAWNKIKEDLKGSEKIGKTHIGLSFQISPEGKLVYEGLLTSDDNAALMDMIHKKTLNWVNQGPIHDLYKSLGGDVSVKESGRRKIKGWEVQQYVMQVKVNAQMPAEQRAMAEKMFGNMSIEIGRMGDYILFSLGQPLDSLAERLFNKEVAHPSIAAMKTYPAGGVFYFDVNLPEMMASMKAMMPADRAAKLPTLPAGAPALTLAGYHLDGMVYYRLSIPRGLLGSAPAAPAAPAVPGAPMPPAAPAPQAPVAPSSTPAAQ